MLVIIEARILIFPGTDFYFPSTSVPPGTFFRLCSKADISQLNLPHGRLNQLRGQGRKRKGGEGQRSHSC